MPSTITMPEPTMAPEMLAKADQPPSPTTSTIRATVPIIIGRRVDHVLAIAKPPLRYSAASGDGVGAPVGDDVGAPVGVDVGAPVGVDVGAPVGDGVGGVSLPMLPAIWS